MRNLFQSEAAQGSAEIPKFVELHPLAVSPLLREEMAEIQRRISPPLEEDWPGERVPGCRDAEIANSPVDTSFVQAFRQALLAGREQSNSINFFDDGAESSWQTHGQGVDDEEVCMVLLSLLKSINQAFNQVTDPRRTKLKDFISPAPLLGRRIPSRR